VKNGRVPTLAWTTALAVTYCAVNGGEHGRGNNGLVPTLAWAPRWRHPRG
jgi:hypothetical protein